MNEPSDRAAQYKDQLPALSKVSLERIFIYLTGACSIFSVLAAFLIKDWPLGATAHNIFLVFIVIALLLLYFLQDRKKLHRYAQSTLFSHYANHLVRDHLSSLQRGKESDLNLVTEKIMDSVAECFSIISGKRCRACIKYLDKEFNVTTFAQDSIGKVLSPKRPPDVTHRLNDNTDFYNLWYAREYCSRYFLAQNLKAMWKDRKYKNSSFQVVGEPGVKSILGMQIITNWTLPYTSTLVVPIRYISKFSPPDPSKEKEDNDECWSYMGFLCIDCRSTNVFNSIYVPELAASFADLLYVMFSNSKLVKESHSQLLDSRPKVYC